MGDCISSHNFTTTDQNITKISGSEDFCMPNPNLHSEVLNLDIKYANLQVVAPNKAEQATNTLGATKQKRKERKV